MHIYVHQTLVQNIYINFFCKSPKLEITQITINCDTFNNGIFYSIDENQTMAASKNLDEFQIRSWAKMPDAKEYIL